MGEGQVSVSALGRALERLEQEMSVPECHGLLCGMICAAGELDEARWREQLLGAGGAIDLLRKEALQPLEQLRQQTLAELADPNLGFSPLLAEPDSDLQQEVQGLAEWCQGFLLGMGEGGITKETKLPQDSREFMADLVRMSAVADYDLEGGEEDDQALFELVEYLRTGVLLLNEELHPTRAAPRMDTLH